MFSLSLPWPFLGWTLLLTPRWGEFGLPWQATLLAVSCLVPLALIGWLYRYELKLVSCFASLVLLATRIVALAALLFLVLLQPIFAFTRTWEEPGRVLVAVDRSQSMDVADPQRKPVDKLRLARALGLNHGVCTDDQLDQWIRDYQDPKMGSPQWVRDDEARDDPRRRGDLEAARRAQHDKVCDLVDHETRAQTEQSILSDDGLGLLSSLAAKQKVDLIGFHSTSWSVPADHPETLFDAPTPTLPHPRGEGREGGAGFTDLHLPLAHGLETAGVGEGRLLGVVLLTDGRHNAGDPPVTKALELGEREVPIYPIGLGSEVAPPQAAILAVKAPPAVYKDASAGVDVRFRVAGLQKQDVELELYHGAGQEKTLLEKRTIHHDGKDREYTESFQVKMDKAGPQTLTAVVHPADPKTTVINADKSSGSAVVSVAKDQASVLLIDGEARWEFHYLQSALKRDPTMETESVVFDQPRLNTKLTDDNLEKIGGPRSTCRTAPTRCRGSTASCWATCRRKNCRRPTGNGWSSSSGSAAARW